MTLIEKKGASLTFYLQGAFTGWFADGTAVWASRLKVFG